MREPARSFEAHEEQNPAEAQFRAHGEPPLTYLLAEKNFISVIDATCPVVLNLQKRIKQAYLESNPKETQVVIYGKEDHAEVNGLVGQTDGTAIVVESEKDLDKIDYEKNICLFSQTTKSIDGFNRIVEEISKRIRKDRLFIHNDTICRQVANRISKIVSFAARHELILFVSGKESSNGKVLFNECRKVNPNIYMISDLEEVDYTIFDGVSSVGICGATSTPKWLMEELKQKIEQNVLK